MGFFDGLLSGVMGAEIVSLVKTFVEKEGGIEGLSAQFEKNGLGPTFRSWVSNGPNAAISADEIEKVLGSDKIDEIAGFLGVPADKIKEVLAQHLPKVVSDMTPDAKIAGQPVAEIGPIAAPDTSTAA